MSKKESFFLQGTFKERAFLAFHVFFWLLIATGYLVKSMISLINLGRSGDEGFFLKELSRFNETGLWKSFSEGISQLHVLLVSFLNTVVGSPLLAGRLLSIVLLPLALFLCYKIIKSLGLAQPVSSIALATLAYILVYCQTGKMFYRMINDPLMIVLALSSIYFLQRHLLCNKTRYIILAALFMGFTLWVRAFSVMIMVGALAYLIWRVLQEPARRKSIIHLLLFAFISCSTALLVQIPSLIVNHTVAFEDKSGDGNWAERNWLTRLNRESNGGVFSYLRVSWKEVEDYKLIHGSQSIPRTMIDVAKKDPKFLLDNVVVNLIIRVGFVLFISTGMFFMLFLDMLRKPGWLLRKTSLSQGGLFFMVTASVSVGLSIVIINYIEHRWLFMAVFSALVLGALHLNRPKLVKKRSYILALQWGFVSLASLAELLHVLIKGF